MYVCYSRRRLVLEIGMALIGWMLGLVGPSWHICVSFYGEKTIIGRAMALPALTEPTPMCYISVTSL